MGNRPEADINHLCFNTKIRRQEGQKQPGIATEKQDLENTVKCHQSGHILIIAARQTIPDQHHGNTTRQADQDDTRHIFRIGLQKNQRQCKHQAGCNQPVLKQRQGERAFILKYLRQGGIVHFGKWWIHHDNQTDGNRNIDRINTHPV